MPTRKRKSAKSDQVTKAKPAKLGKDKPAVSNGVSLWQILLGIIILCAVGVAAAVVLGVITIDDINAGPLSSGRKALVEEPVFGEDVSHDSESFDSDEAESNKSKLKEKEKITPEVKRAENHPQSVNEDSTETNDEDEEIFPPAAMETENDSEESEAPVDEKEIEVTYIQDEEIPQKQEETENLDDAEMEDTDDHNDVIPSTKEEAESLREESPPPVEEMETEDTGTLPVEEIMDVLDEAKNSDNQEDQISSETEENEKVDVLGKAEIVIDDQDEVIPSQLLEESENVDVADGGEIEVADIQDEEVPPPPLEGTEIVGAVDKEEPHQRETENVGEAEISFTGDQNEEIPPPQPSQVEGTFNMDETEIELADDQDEEPPLPQEEVENIDVADKGEKEVAEDQDKEMPPPPKEKEENVGVVDEADIKVTVGQDEELPLQKVETENVDGTKIVTDDQAEQIPPPKKETENLGVVSRAKIEVTDNQEDEEASAGEEEEQETVDALKEAKVEVTDDQDGELLSPQEQEMEKIDELKVPLEEKEIEVSDGQEKEKAGNLDENSAPIVSEREVEVTEGRDAEAQLQEETGNEQLGEEAESISEELGVDGREDVDSQEEENSTRDQKAESVEEKPVPTLGEIEVESNNDTDERVSPPPKKETGTVNEEESITFANEMKTEGSDDILEKEQRGDLAGSDVQEKKKTVQETGSFKEEPVKESKAEKENSDPLLNAADLKLANKIEQADKLLQQKKTEQALRKFESLLKQHPGSPRVRYGRAQALDQMAEEKRSNDILKSSITAYGEVPEGSDCPDELKKLALRRQAERMSFMGQTRPSVTVLTGLMKDFPSDVQIKKELGVQYLIMGADARAKPLFQQVLKLDPEDGFAKVHLGFILKREGLFEEAIVLLREGIESNQEGTAEGKYFFHLGDAYHRTGNPEEANAIYAIGAEKGLFRSAMQRSLYNVDTLHGQPWWTPKEAKFEAAVQLLESKWQIILKEGLSLMDKETQLFQAEDESLRDTGDWKQFMLYIRGKKDTKNCARAPETCKIIDSIPQSAGCKRGQVKFSVMHPGTHVWPHTGPTNCRLRSHLGLVIPEGTRIRVVNETRSWEEGKVLIFDDSFEHEVWQEADSFRLVLIVDLWHPELTEQQKRYLSPI